MLMRSLFLCFLEVRYCGALALLICMIFSSSGHARRSCVTVRRDFPRFKMKKDCPINRLSVAGQPFLSVFSATTSFTSVCY